MRDLIARFLTSLSGESASPSLMMLATDHLDCVRVGSERAEADLQATRFIGEPVASGDRQIMYRRANGIGVMTIDGVLTSRGLAADDRYRVVPYEALQARFRAAGADPSVHTIVADWNSPGGRIAGMVETAAIIRQISASKRVISIANPTLASAAYFVAAAGSQIIVSPSSVTGSLGVVMQHTEFSKLFAMLGIKTTLIASDPNKVAGNEIEPLPEAVQAEFKSEVDRTAEMMFAALGSYRPKLGAQGARATQAKVFRADEAVTLGLADRVATFDQIIAELSSAGHAATTGATMTTANPQPAAATPGTTETTAATTKPPTPNDRDAERGRVKAITTCEAAKGREQLANHLAFDTDMSVEAATAILEKSPKGGATTPSIEQRMGGQGADLALGGPMGKPKGEASDAKAELNPAAVYGARAKARSQRALN